MNSRQIRKMVLTAMFACLSFVLCTFVYFPAMAPFQHFVNVIAAVFIGPWYGMLAAFLCGVLRMMSGRTIISVLGAIFGALLAGLFYRRTHRFWSLILGELIGTGIISAILCYYPMKYIYGMDLQSPFYYIPFFVPASFVGSCLGVAVLLMLRRSGVMKRMLSMLGEEEEPRQ